jgi:hypothetical protein
MDRTLPAWKKVVTIIAIIALGIGAFYAYGKFLGPDDPEDPDPREFRGW